MVRMAVVGGASIKDQATGAESIKLLSLERMVALNSLMVSQRASEAKGYFIRRGRVTGPLLRHFAPPQPSQLTQPTTISLTVAEELATRPFPRSLFLLAVHRNSVKEPATLQRSPGPPSGMEDDARQRRQYEESKNTSFYAHSFNSLHVHTKCLRRISPSSP